MKLLFLFVLSLLCTSCVGGLTYQYTNIPSTSVYCKRIPIYIDINFSNANKLYIDNAINAWNYVLNGYIKLDVVSYSFDMEPSELKSIFDNNGVMILQIDSDSNFLPPSKIEGNAIDGITDRVGGNTIYLIRDRLSDKIEQITLHELGHILGALDMEGDTVMNGTLSPKYSKCIDERAMEAVAAFQHLDPNKLNYCRYFSA